LLCAGFCFHPSTRFFRAERPEGEARNLDIPRAHCFSALRVKTYCPAGFEFSLTISSAHSWAKYHANYSEALLSTNAPDGRRPGRALTKVWKQKLAHNGRLYATLPEPIKRARD